MACLSLCGGTRQKAAETDDVPPLVPRLVSWLSDHFIFLFSNDDYNSKESASTQWNRNYN